MKKILIPAIVLFVLCLSSCNNNNANGGNNGENADSVSNDTCVLAPGEVPDEETEGNNNFMSPDTKLNELHGQVKKCITKSGECDENGKATSDTYWTTEVKVFDREGFIDTKSKELDWRLNDPIITRNEQKQITSVKWFVSEFNSYVTEEYTYNKDGMLKTCNACGVESVDLIKYEFDGDKLIKSSSEGAGEGSVFRNTTSYKILETDDNGNWTRRLLKQVFEDGPDDGSGTYDNSITSYSIEERTITYYE